MSTYVEMLARTTVMKIHNEAVKNEFVAHGEDLVIISYHLPTCEMCKPWNGRIVSLTGATKGYPTMTDAEAEGLFHPNCRHAFSLYIPDNPYRGLTEEYLTRAAEHINEMDEGEKKSFISQLAKRAGQPYNPDTKSGDEVYYADDGSPIYPPNNGAYWPQESNFVLKAGMIVDRYGYPDGDFLSPDDLAKEKRALAYADKKSIRTRYRVKRDVIVDRGIVLPWFGQIGGGEQYKLPAYVKNLPDDFEELK